MSVIFSVSLKGDLNSKAIERGFKRKRENLSHFYPSFLSSKGDIQGNKKASKTVSARLYDTNECIVFNCHTDANRPLAIINAEDGLL